MGVPSDHLSCLKHPLIFSFGRRATDNRPVAREMTFGDYGMSFLSGTATRGTLTASEYRARNRNKPAEKKRRNKEKDGAYFLP